MIEALASGRPGLRLRALLITLSLSVSVARAQSIPTAVADARAQFRAGVDAAHVGRWNEALSFFTRAYAAEANPVILFNLAGAQVHNGYRVDGAASYRRFLRDAVSPPASEFRGAAIDALREVEARLGHVHASVTDPRAGDTLRIDDQSLAPDISGDAVSVEPGAHHIELVRDGHVVASTVVTLAPGEVRDATLAAPPVTVPATIVRPLPRVRRVAFVTPHRRVSTVATSPVFWTVLGLVVAGGIAAGIVLVVEHASEHPIVVGSAGNLSW